VLGCERDGQKPPRRGETDAGGEHQPAARIFATELRR